MLTKREIIVGFALVTRQLQEEMSSEPLKILTIPILGMDKLSCGVDFLPGIRKVGEP